MRLDPDLQASSAAAPPALDRRRPFTRAQARAAGISGRSLTGPTHRRLFHDRYVSADVEVTTALRARAALDIAGPDAHVSGVTAAALWGAWVPGDPEVHVGVPDRSRRTRTRGIRAHLVTGDADLTTVQGLPVTTPGQTFVDLAVRLGIVDLVVLGDSLISRGLVTRDELIDRTVLASGAGVRRARRAVALVRAGVESPMESRARMLVVLARLPEPVVAHELRRPDGRVLRLDHCYPEWRVGYEYEGRQHAESSAQWQHDLARREQLDRMGIRLVLVTAEDIYRRPGATLDRLVSAVREHAGVRLSVRGDEWRRHFPGRR